MSMGSGEDDVNITTASTRIMMRFCNHAGAEAFVTASRRVSQPDRPPFEVLDFQTLSHVRVLGLMYLGATKSPSRFSAPRRKQPDRPSDLCGVVPDSAVVKISGTRGNRHVMATLESLSTTVQSNTTPVPRKRSALQNPSATDFCACIR
jgi:hypothetical protein